MSRKIIYKYKIDEKNKGWFSSYWALWGLDTFSACLYEGSFVHNHPYFFLKNINNKIDGTLS
jgi:hypothetical protein